LRQWVKDALAALGGSGTVVDVAAEIWKHHESELRASGELFYTWQYDMRWAAQLLRDAGVAQSASDRRRGVWELIQG
jgi:hypothetical protein